MALRLLLVEDNATDALIMREVLKNSGWVLEIRTVSDGEAALEAVDEFAPRLILLDLNLPKFSGLEVLAEIRRRDSLAGVPVVIVSSSHLTRDVEAARELNAAAYFCKPDTLAGFTELAEIVCGVLGAAVGGIS